MKKKLNNKGNTLAIVIIGIFILSILGTLILGITSTNYRMKLNDKKNETTFYYAEKAVDEVYAGIGNDIMECVTSSYTQVLEEYISIGASVDKNKANDEYEELLHNKITDMYKDGNIKNVAPSTTNIDEMFNRIYSKSYISQVNKYKFTLFSPSTTATEIKYYKTVVDPSDATKTILQEVLLANGDTYKDVDLIKIYNVGLRCESTNLDYASSIISDFEIKVPDIDMDFSDSKSTLGLDSLSSYSLICEGAGLQNDYFTTPGTRINPAISIDKNSKVVIKGNVYADGTVYNAVDKTITGASGANVSFKENTSTVVGKNPSINIGNNSELSINAKILACNNDFILNTSSVATLRNMAGASTYDATDTLQFFVNNIRTENGTNGAKLDIAGNTIVKDDLEINGDDSTVNLSGNYFGYGYRDNNNDGDEDNSNAITGFVVSPATTSEHLQSSAMIINGNGATLNMTGLSKLILAGRAYIDLDASGTNTSYMTGESLSFKGNQNVYLATNELIGSKVSGTNPIKMTQLSAFGYVNNGQELNYDILGITADNANNVVAKKIDEDVYFYVKNPNPAIQTQYFVNTITNDANKIVNLKDQIRNLNVKNVSFSDSLASYTVGTIMKASTAGGIVDTSIPVYGESGQAGNRITKSDFLSICSVINNRFENLVPALKDISSTHILGQDNYIEPTVSTTMNPFEYYIDREKMYSKYGKDRKEYDIDIQNISATQSSLDSLTLAEQTNFINELKKILVDEGVLDPSYSNIGSIKVGYIISTESGTTIDTAIPFDVGVIISDVPYKISKNFTGLIICNGEIKISGNISINASVELSKLFLSKIPKLHEILNDGLVGNEGVDENGTIVDANSIKYTDLVEKTNWRKSNE